MANTKDESLRDYARKSLKKKQDFKQYLWVYLGVTILVSAIWYLTTPGGYFWPIWVVFGMGAAAIFIAIDAYGTLGKRPISDADVDAEVERLKRKG